MAQGKTRGICGARGFFLGDRQRRVAPDLGPGYFFFFLAVFLAGFLAAAFFFATGIAITPFRWDVGEMK
jgi:hypothetical protein